MATIGQLLVKIRNASELKYDGETGYYLVSKSQFIKILQAPGTPSYTAKKTILEKWGALLYHPGLVIRDGTDNPGYPYYWLSAEVMEDLINQFMPAAARNNLAAKNMYLKYGRC